MASGLVPRPVFGARPTLAPARAVRRGDCQRRVVWRLCPGVVQTLEAQLAAETRRNQELELELRHARSSSDGPVGAPRLVDVSGEQIAHLHSLIRCVQTAGVAKVCARVVCWCRWWVQCVLGVRCGCRENS